MDRSQSEPAMRLAAGEAPLESISFAGLSEGPRLLILGAVHGNETCGPNAIRRAIEACRTGALHIVRGTVTFVPVTNPKAYFQQTREGDRNLNRDLHDKPVPRDFEDRIGNRLCQLLRAHDVLLDIHSFRGEGEPFVFFGPQDNKGALEPFRHAAAEAGFAARLGPSTIIYGWLENYARLIAARSRLGLPALSPTEGHGTTEYMRFCGGYAATIECGSHDDPHSAEIGYAAILNALAEAGLVDAGRPAISARSVIHMDDVIICEQEGDRLEGDWKTGDAIAAGRVFARRADGTAVRAPQDGFLIFPHAKAEPGEGICYFGTQSSRKL